MINTPVSRERRQQIRRELLRQYVELQRELAEGDPSFSAYQGTVHAFRRVGFALITAGFEDDLDRLLRMRVLDGGRSTPSPRHARDVPPDLYLIERRAR